MIVLLDLTKVLKTIAFTNVYHKINNNSKKRRKFS